MLALIIDITVPSSRPYRSQSLVILEYEYMRSAMERELAKHPHKRFFFRLSMPQVGLGVLLEPQSFVRSTT